MTRWQTLFGSLLAALLFLACGGPTPPGFALEETVRDLGELDSGPTIPLTFPFQVGQEAVRIDRLTPSCGCLRPRILVAGQEVPLGTEMAPGTKGVVAVDYATAGFLGRKFTGVKITGSGPGLPAEVEVQSWLRSWFEVEPRAVQFGSVNGEQEERRQVVITGREPFRLTGLLGGAPPLEVAGIPSAEKALSQTIEIVLPPTTAEGRHAGFLNLATDQEGYPVPLAVEYTVAGRLWTLPDRRVLLGQVPVGMERFETIEIGAREGRLGTPEVVLEGIPGGESQVETLSEGSRYRIQLKVVPDAAGTLSGEVLLRLPYTWAGTQEIVERRLQVFGVVRDA
jgi:hypothetical protein